MTAQSIKFEILTFNQNGQMVRFLIFSLFFSSTIFAQSLSSRNANYNISATLEPTKKLITGFETIEWTNTTNASTSELQFHLYLNAFKDFNSTFNKESKYTKKIDKNKINKLSAGRVTIHSFKIENGEELSNQLSYIQPDDENLLDQTVISIPLKKPVNPGEKISINIVFESKLPEMVARTGWAAGDYFLVGQWFPKIGVLENSTNGKSKWNCHQFHANTEFFADFGVYNVNITVPEKYKVGATGSLISEIKNKKGTKTFIYKAEDVHDFAWTTSPFYQVSEQNYKGIKIMAFMQPEHSSQTSRYFDSAKNAIDFMTKHVGKYPHKTLSLIDPPIAGSASNGMEYPTFITCGSSWGVGKWAKFTEVVTIHEFIHQYFQGMLASNEFESSWLDEGFTQYYEGRVMDAYYYRGSQLNVFGFTLNDAAASRFSYVTMTNPHISDIYENAWQYPTGTYGVLTYQKTATWLKTLEGLLERKTFDLALKEYFETYKFKHPKAENFIEIINKWTVYTGKYKDMNWFFEQVLFKAPTCDYSVKKINNEKSKRNLEIENKGQMKIPTIIHVTFNDNSVKIIKWNGEESLKKYSFDKNISRVELDPQRINWMDLNIINNSLSVSEPTLLASKFSSKVIFWFQNFIMFFT